MMARNLMLLAGAVLIGVAPFLMTFETPPTFDGTDNRGREAIRRDHPDYRPWTQVLWTPPSPEIESLLFALQAAIGAGVIGYYVGLSQGRAQRRDAGADARSTDTRPKVPHASC
ncbi:MAG: energy-coupling factor ABC transporter substrate-binding protein [Alphaproteobacteria bacterium]